VIIKHFKNNKDVWSEVEKDKVEVYYFTKDTKDRYFATRKAISDIVSKKEEIASITDTGIRKILENHLEANNGDIEKAFSPEGIEEMNRNIYQLNNNAPHKPIYKARKFEKADKFAVGKEGNKSSKFVEAAKGTNLYFAIYETETLNEETGKIVKKRTYATIPLNVVIDRLKQGLSPAPANENGSEPKFVLSPNDLVYVPGVKKNNDSSLDVDNLYKMVSSSGNQCFFIKGNVANPIIDKVEFSTLNKTERAITGEMIKEVCIPVKLDRLGNIIKIGY
jgi:CRISPR-associated endonuclease Csn1